MKQLFFSFVIMLLWMPLVLAQESKTTELSLQQCVQMAVEKNINVRTARIDQEKSNYKKDETRAPLLPKVSLSGSFQDNLAEATTVLPGSFMKYFGGSGDEDVAVSMGTQFNTTASLSISQVLFNKTAYLAMDIAKKSTAISTLSVEKAREEIATEVAKLYFLAQTTTEQQKLIEGNITRAEKMKAITKVTVDNGVGKQVDLDRVIVNLENYYTQWNNTQATLEQQLNMMKYLLNMPQEQEITLTDKADMVLLQDPLLTVSDFSDHVDVKLLESQQEMNKLNEKSIQSGYLPTLSVTGLLAYQGLKADIKDYFSSDSKWYPYSYVNLSLSVPLFDGGEKRAKFQQAKLESQKTQEKLESTKENLGLHYKIAMNNYLNNQTNVTRQQNNLKLAEKVYDETSLKYREGMATMSNLLQDETGLSNAQAGYLTALYNLKDAEVKILSLSGHIQHAFQK
jgi:outer membrane protein